MNLTHLQRIRKLTLVLLTLATFGSVHSQPQSGNWKATADFGEFTITVAAGGSSISKIAYNFVAFRCGGVGISISGGMTVSSSWSITNNQFMITTNLNSNPMGTSWPHVINGTFSATGEQVSGTWSANVAGSGCSGGWGPISHVVSVDESREIPKRCVLGQNYPNPFNPSTTITYELPRASHVILSVHDMLGREVSVLVNDRRDAGVHEIKFGGSGLASGVYFYRLRAGDFVQSKKLIIVK